MSDQDPYGDPTRVDLPSVDPTQAMPASAGAPPPAAPPPTDEPPDEPPDRRWWILAALVATVLVIGLAIVLLSDDDAGDAVGSTTTSSTATTGATTTEATTTTTEATTTEATTTTQGPSPTVAPGLCVSSAPDDPETTAQVVFQAWTLRDERCAANLMTSDALDQLFALSGDGSNMTFMGCFDQENPDPHTLCSYTYPGGATNFRMDYSDTEGWKVYEVFQSAD